MCRCDGTESVHEERRIEAKIILFMSQRGAKTVVEKRKVTRLLPAMTKRHQIAWSLVPMK